ncbi:Uncharacterized protein FWK35_00022121 [Aphis craccivora]|uniref:Uncharacterized protein n=1 Tax=Aphis craccivora TaxID=307492 RepID=A0A6G0ZFJ5_APHCR|nr:Uncharacterized protein FWK35_00022121 [Aphis craccivora]
MNRIWTGDKKGNIVHILRITLDIRESSDIPLKKITIPESLTFEMTIIKSRRQSFEKVGLFVTCKDTIFAQAVTSGFYFNTLTTPPGSQIICVQNVVPIGFLLLRSNWLGCINDGSENDSKTSLVVMVTFRSIAGTKRTFDWNSGIFLMFIRRIHIQYPRY